MDETEREVLRCLVRAGGDRRRAVVLAGWRGLKPGPFRRAMQRLWDGGDLCLWWRDVPSAGWTPPKLRSYGRDVGQLWWLQTHIDPREQRFVRRIERDMRERCAVVAVWLPPVPSVWV